MDRGTVEFLMGIVLATAYWLVPRDQVVAWARRVSLRAPKPKIVTVTLTNPDGVVVQSKQITFLPPPRRPWQVL